MSASRALNSKRSAVSIFGVGSAVIASLILGPASPARVTGHEQKKLPSESLFERRKFAGFPQGGDQDALPPGAVARLGSPRLRHGNSVADIACSPDGSRIASCSSDQTIRVWDSTSGQELHRVQWENRVPKLVRFTADGKTLVAAGSSAGKTPEIWRIDPDTGKLLASHRFPNAADYGFDLTSDGTRFAACDHEGKIVFLFDTSTGRKLWQAQLKKGGSCVAFARDGRTLAATDFNSIQLFDMDGKPAGRFTVEIEPEPYLFHLAISPDGSRVAACWSPERWQSYLVVWDRKSGKRLWTNNYLDSHSCTPYAFSPDGKWIVREGVVPIARGTVILTDAATGKDGLEFPVGRAKGCVSFRDDGRLMAAASGAIQTFDPKTGQSVAPSADPPEGVYLRRFSANGRTLFGVSDGWYAWDVVTGRQRRLKGPWDNSDCVISPDGGLMAEIDHEQKVLIIYDVNTGKVLHKHKGEQLANGHLLSFTPGGKEVIWNIWGESKIWSVETGKEQLAIGKPGTHVGCKAMSADGKFIAMCDEEDPIRVWEMPGGREICRLPPTDRSVSMLSLSASGQRIAAAFYSNQKRGPYPEAIVWDTASRKVVARVPQSGSNPCLELSPDGRTVALSEFNFDVSHGELRVYEVLSGSLRMTFHHAGTMGYFYYSPNSKTIAATSEEAPVYLWDLTGDSLGQPAWVRADADAVWNDLGSADAAKAFRAMRKLRGNPGPGLAFLKERVRPPAVTVPDAETLKKLFAALGADDFEEREKAQKTLAEFDDAIKSEMVREVAQSPSPEVRARLQKLIDRLEISSASRWRLVRVVEAVEGMETPKADELLATWARGPASATLTKEAEAALARRRTVKRFLAFE